MSTKKDKNISKILKNKKRVNKMQNNDQIDLKSVNKTPKKPLQAIKKAVTPQKGPKRDDEGKFTSGGGGLNLMNKFNWRRAVPLILIVAIIGGFFVYRSFAYSSNDLASIPKPLRGTDASVIDPFVIKAYRDIHNEYPTLAERLYWPAEAKKLHKPNDNNYNLTIKYQIYNRIGAATPAVRAEKAAQVKQGNGVIATINPDQMKDGSRRRSIAGVSSYFESKAPGNQVMPVQIGANVGSDRIPLTKVAWDSSWPQQVRVCSTFFAQPSYQYDKSSLNFTVNGTSTAFTIDTASDLAERTKRPIALGAETKGTIWEGKSKIPLHKKTVCSGAISKPSTNDVNIAFSKNKSNSASNQSTSKVKSFRGRLMLESYTIVAK